MSGCLSKNRDSIRNVWFALFLIMLVFVASKMLTAVLCFTSIPVLDESLYLNTARSLHYEGKLLYHAQPAQLRYILYPAVLSVAYLFYTPEGILTVMRLFGTVIYSLGFIPVFLLSRRVLGSSLKALAVVIAACLIPETNYALFIAQEVTHFPLMMLAFYLIYMTWIYEQPHRASSAGSKYAFYHIMLGVVFFLLNESKAVGIVMILTYCFYSPIVEFCIFKRCKGIFETAKKLLFTIAPFILLTLVAAVAKDAMYAHSGFPVHEEVSPTSIGALFFIQYYWDSFITLILAYLEETLSYIFYFCAALLLMPVFAPIMGYRELDEADKKLLLFAFSVTFLTIIVVVVTVNVPEGGIARFMQPVNLRYLYYTYVPLFILSAKLIGKELRINAGACALLLLLVLQIIIKPDFSNIAPSATFSSVSLAFSNYTEAAALFILVFLATAVVLLYLFIKRRYMLSAKVLIISTMLLASWFVFNTALYSISMKNRSVDSGNFIGIAQVLEREENVLMVGGVDPRLDSFLELDAYFRHGYNYVAVWELQACLSEIEPAEGAIGFVRLEDIVPAAWKYKQPMFPLGEIDYVVVAKGVELINAQLLPVSETSALFDVYRIENSTVWLKTGG